MRRRDFLKLAATGAGALTIGPYLRPFTAFAQSVTPFLYGVASGDPLANSVIIWTRITPHPDAAPGSGAGPDTTVGWEVATDPVFRQVVRSGHVLTSAARDHTVKVDVDGLEPGKDYFYRFLWDSFASATGRTRTAPAQDAHLDCIRFGVVSCSNWEGGYFSAYRHIAQRDDLDFVVHLGDYIYEYGPGGYGEGSTYGRVHQPPKEQVVLADYRQRHAQYKSDPDLAQLHARYPFIVTWDDHEVANNTWKDGAQNHQLSEGDFHQRRNSAYQAFFEWLPIRLPEPAAAPLRIYRRFRFGGLAELSMLDLRQYRDKQVEGIGVGPLEFPTSQELDDPNRTITGSDQMQWLIAGLQASQSRWKLIGNPVMIAALKYGSLPALPPATPIPSGGAPLNSDQWDGYTADRARLLGAIADRQLHNTVFLTGDIHSSWASDLPLDPGAYPASPSVATEFIGTSVNSDNVDEVTGQPSDSIEAAAMAGNRHLKFVELDSHGYSIAEASEEKFQFDWYYITDRADPNAKASFGASFLTKDGSQSISPSPGPLGDKQRRPAASGSGSVSGESLAATGGASPAPLGATLAAAAVGLGLLARGAKRSDPASDNESPR